MNLDPAPPRAGVSMRWHLLAIAFAIGLCALAAVGLWHLRVTLVQSQARELRLLALALADGTDRGLDGVQDGLQAVRAELARGALPTVGPDAAALASPITDLMAVTLLAAVCTSSGSVIKVVIGGSLHAGACRYRQRGEADPINPVSAVPGNQ